MAPSKALLIGLGTSTSGSSDFAVASAIRVNSLTRRTCSGVVGSVEEPALASFLALPLRRALGIVELSAGSTAIPHCFAVAANHVAIWSVSSL